MSNTALEWGCCSSKAHNNHFKQCSSCKRVFHFECLAISGKNKNVSNESKSSWICPKSVSSNPKPVENDSTPVCSNQNVTIRANKRQALRSPSDPAVVESKITSEEVRAIVQKIVAREIEGLVSKLNQSFRTLLNSELETMRNEIKELKQSVSFMNNQYEDVLKENKEMKVLVKEMHSENCTVKSTIKDLTFRLNKLEQSASSSNIEIQCVPEKKDEDLVNIVTKLSNIIDYNLSTEKIMRCTRIAKINRNTSRPRSIVVQFTTPTIRDHFLATIIKYNKSKQINEKLNSSHLGFSGDKTPIFVVEHLAPGYKALHAATRLAVKENGYKHVWIRNGGIYVRKTDNSDYIMIRDMDSINKIK